MPSAADLERNWYLRLLGLDSYPGSLSDLQTLVESGSGVNAFKNTAKPFATRALVDKLKSAVQPATVGVLGDSTGNGTNEWVYTAHTSLGSKFPVYNIPHRLWNDTKQAYDDETWIQTSSLGRRRYTNTNAATDATFVVNDSASTSIV